MKKYLPWIIGILAIIAVGYFFLKKKSPVAMLPGDGIEKDASLPEAKVQAEIAWMRRDPATVSQIRKKAADEGRSFEQQLRLDAEWYVRKNLGIS